MIVFTNIGAKPLELGLRIDRRDRAEASLDRLGGVEAEILAKARGDHLYALGRPSATPTGTATEGRPGKLTVTISRDRFPDHIEPAVGHFDGRARDA